MLKTHSITSLPSELAGEIAGACSNTLLIDPRLPGTTNTFRVPLDTIKPPSPTRPVLLSRPGINTDPGVTVTSSINVQVPTSPKLISMEQLVFLSLRQPIELNQEKMERELTVKALPLALQVNTKRLAKG